MPLPSLTTDNEKGSFSQRFLEKATKTKDASKKLLDNLFGKPQQKTGTAGAPSKLGSAFGQKDPQRTTIGSGSSARLKVKDSIADIVAKQYLFMQKTYEKQKQEDELNVAFRKEQLEEDERRHKKLIDELIKFKKTAVPEKEKELTKEEEKDDGSWIQKMLGGIKNAFFSTLKGLISVIMSPIKLLTSLVSSIMGIVTSIATTLAKTVFEVIAKGAEGIVKLLLLPLSSLISSIVAGAFKTLYKGVMALGEAFLSFLSPIGKVIATILGVAYGDATYRQEEQKDTYGPEFSKIQDEYIEEEVDKNLSVGENNLRRAENKKRKDENNDRAAKARAQYEKETLIPAMEIAGYIPSRQASDKLDASLITFKHEKTGKTAGIEDIKSALYGENWAQKELMKRLYGEDKTFKEVMTDGLNNLKNDASSTLDNSLKPLIDPLKSNIAKVESTVENLVTQSHSLIDTAKNEAIPTLKSDFNAGREYAKSGDAVITTSNKIDNGKVTLNAPMESRHGHVQPRPSSLERVF